jgi:F-type H+-transporting ATPase subunit a
VEQMPKRKGWRWGFNRWLVLLFIVLGAVAAKFYPPIQPHVQLPAEPVPSITLILIVLAVLAVLLTILARRWEMLSVALLFGVMAALPIFFGIAWVNTLTAVVICDLILMLIAFGVYRAVKGESLIPKGLAGALEYLLEYLYNMTESTAGKWAKTIFPWFATITLLVLVANWMELIPAVDSVGIIEPGGHAAVQDLGWANTLVKPPATNAEEAAAEGGAEGYTLVPFVRVVSTDLNFTVALALIAVFMVQVIGIRAQGGHYFGKFWNTKTLFNKPIFGAIDFAVGLLEVISEFSKVLSFSFRLFGNLFAGSVLLFVIGSLVPVFAQSFFLLLEFFVGLIQALVFGLLTMTFMAQATQGHGEELDEA